MTVYINKGFDQKSEILEGHNDTLVMWPRVTAESVIPAVASVEILSPTGNILVPNTAAVVDGVTGKLSFSQVWGQLTYPRDEDYVAVWTFTSAGVQYVERQYFDVVISKLVCPVDTNQLLELYPNIVQHLAAVQVTDASRFIRQAWGTVLDRIRAAGNRPSLIMESIRLAGPTKALAASLVCDALSRDPTDVWWARARNWEAEYNARFSGLGSLKYDVDEDGVHDGDEETARVARVRFLV